MKSLIGRLLLGLSRLPGPRTTVLALVLAALVGVLDYTTGYELHVTAFYLLPVCWAAWAAGRQAGLILAAACAVIFAAASLMTRPPGLPQVILLWNALMLLAMFFGAVYLITVALDLEQAKVKAQRLLQTQEKLATLGTLTAGIAHEIRNPLTSLKARLYTLEKHLQTVPAARKDIDIVGAEIARLDRIVQDALSFARPADPKLESLAADSLLREVQGLMSSDLGNRAVQLVVEPNPELHVRADSGHLKQVLINLVRNAADAIVGAGTVTLRAREARASLGGRETDAVVLEVSDTGTGIPPEVERRLFDPFFSTKETGTGLGLPIAARIVERHGGTLQYQTRPGHGTTFGVVLPRESRDIAGSADCSENSSH